MNNIFSRAWLAEQMAKAKKPVPAKPIQRSEPTKAEPTPDPRVEIKAEPTPDPEIEIKVPPVRESQKTHLKKKKP